MKSRQCKILIGGSEWCSLPGLKTPLIKAKVDTGAKTSAIHAYDITPFVKNQTDWVKFTIHPLQQNDKVIYRVQAPIVDRRYVTSSNGQKEKRFVIATQLLIGPLAYEIQLTLSNRDPLRYRMLLGCEALNGHAIVDPSEACLLGKYTPYEVMRKYR